MLVDLAVTKQGSTYVSRKFAVCLSVLAWDDIDRAMQLFVGMCSQDCICPVISRGDHGCLKMSWKNDGHELIVWLYKNTNRLKYALGNVVDGKAQVVEIGMSDVETLLEYWGAFLNQDEKPSKPYKLRKERHESN